MPHGKPHTVTHAPCVTVTNPKTNKKRFNQMLPIPGKIGGDGRQDPVKHIQESNNELY